MTLRKVSTSTAVALATAVSALAFAPASTFAAQGEATFMSAPKAGDMRAAKWLGTPIKNAGNEEIGDINDFLIGSDGKVHAVIVGVGGFLGIAEKNVAIPFEQVKMSMDGEGNRMVMASLTKEQLEAAPTFKVTGDKTLRERADEASEKAGSAYEQAKEKLQNTYESAKESLKETYESTKEAGREAAESASETAREAADETKDAVTGRETKITQ